MMPCVLAGADMPEIPKMFWQMQAESTPDQHSSHGNAHHRVDSTSSVSADQK